jgi:hypothetical protein
VTRAKLPCPWKELVLANLEVDRSPNGPMLRASKKIRLPGRRAIRPTTPCHCGQTLGSCDARTLTRLIEARIRLER